MRYLNDQGRGLLLAERMVGTWDSTLITNEEGVIDG